MLLIKAKLPKSDKWVTLDMLDEAGSKFQLDLQANQIGKLETRSVIKSTLITLPKSSTNEKVMGFISNLNDAYNIASSKMPCKVFYDGFEVLSGAYFVLMEATHEHFEIKIIGGLADLFHTLKETRLRDTKPAPDYFSNWVPWNVAGIEATANNPTCIPIVDWNVEDNPTTLGDGDDGSAPWIQASTLYPAIKIAPLFKAIIEEHGYALNWPIFNDDRFQKAAILCVSGNIAPLEEKDWRAAFDQLLTGPIVLNNDNPKYKFDHPNVLNSFSPPISPYTQLTHRVTQGKYTYRITVETDQTLRITVKKGTEVIDRRIISSGRKAYYKDFDFFNEANINFEVELARENTAASITFLNIECTSYEAINEDMFPNRNFNVIHNLPDISQLDFIKEVLLMFGLMVDVDSHYKEMFCYNWNTIYAQAYTENLEFEGGNPNYYNWSKYATVDEKEKQIYEFGSYAQKSIIKYKDAEYTNDYDKPITVKSEGIMNIVNQHLVDEKVMIEFKSEACEDVPRFNRVDKNKRLKLAKIRHRQNAQAPGDAAMHIVYLENDDFSILGLRDDSATRIVNGLPYATFAEVSAPELVEAYYSYLAYGILRKTRILTEFLVLPPDRVANFKHRHPIFLEKYHQWFFVNKLTYRGGITRCELVLLSQKGIGEDFYKLPPKETYKMEILPRPERKL